MAVLTGARVAGRAAGVMAMPDVKPSALNDFFIPSVGSGFDMGDGLCHGVTLLGLGGGEEDFFQDMDDLGHFAVGRSGPGDDGDGLGNFIRAEALKIHIGAETGHPRLKDEIVQRFRLLRFFLFFRRHIHEVNGAFGSVRPVFPRDKNLSLGCKKV